MTNRLSTLPILALVAALLFGARRVRRGVVPLVVACLTSLALWLPWWSLDPLNYAPLTRVSFVGPPAGQLLIATLFTGAIALAAVGPRIVRSDRLWERATCYGPIFALALAPVGLWAPEELFRLAPFLALGIPAAAAAVAAVLGTVPASRVRSTPSPAR